MKTAGTDLLLLTMSGFWSPWPPRWAPEGSEVVVIDRFHCICVCSLTSGSLLRISEWHYLSCVRLMINIYQTFQRSTDAFQWEQFRMLHIQGTLKQIKGFNNSCSYVNPSYIWGLISGKLFWHLFQRCRLHTNTVTHLTDKRTLQMSLKGEWQHTHFHSQ